MLDCEQTSDIPDGQATSGVKSQTETNWRSGFDSDQDGRRGKPKEEAQVMTPTKARETLVQRMARYGFTPEMCADKSSDQLLHIAAILVQHRMSQGSLEADEIIRLGEMEKLAAELRQVN